MTIAFDVDGTLFDVNDKPRKEIIELLKALASTNEIVVWSASSNYAEMMARKAGIFDLVSICSSKTNLFLKGVVDISFDDQVVKLAKYNIKV